MLIHIELAERFTRGQSFENFLEDLMPLYAVIRCLEVISEASLRLSDDLKARHPSIPWREMAAAGNLYRHDYEDVLPRRVWKTLREELPPLRVVFRTRAGQRVLSACTSHHTCRNSANGSSMVRLR
jgi:uncharacterized protein with HEPN domain